MQDPAYNPLRGPLRWLLRLPTPRRRGLHVVVVHKDSGKWIGSGAIRCLDFSEISFRAFRRKSLQAGGCALRSNACRDRLRLRRSLEVGGLRSFPAFEPDAQLPCAMVGSGGQGTGPLDGVPNACPPGCRCRDPQGRPEAASPDLRWVGTLLRHPRSPASTLPVRVLARGAAARGVGSPSVRRPLAVRVPPERAQGPAVGVSA